MVKKITFEEFETSGKNNFAAIYFDMLKSKAWNELSGNAVKVYMIMRSKYSRKVQHGYIVDSNKDDISISYKETGLTQHTFEKSIDQLIDLGFIKVNEYKAQGGFKKLIIYGFSNQWKHYNTAKFKIEDKWKRMCNRESI